MQVLDAAKGTDLGKNPGNSVNCEQHTHFVLGTWPLGDRQYAWVHLRTQECYLADLGKTPCGMAPKLSPLAILSKLSKLEFPRPRFSRPLIRERFSRHPLPFRRPGAVGTTCMISSTGRTSPREDMSNTERGLHCSGPSDVSSPSTTHASLAVCTPPLPFVATFAWNAAVPPSSEYPNPGVGFSPKRRGGENGDTGQSHSSRCCSAWGPIPPSLSQAFSQNCSIASLPLLRVSFAS